MIQSICFSTALLFAQRCVMIVEIAFFTLLSESRAESFSNLCRRTVAMAELSTMCTTFIQSSGVCLPVLFLLFVLAEVMKSHILIVEELPGSIASFLSKDNFCDFLEVELVLGSGSQLENVFLNIRIIKSSHDDVS